MKAKMLMLLDRGSLQPRPSVLRVKEKMLMLPEGGRTKIYPILASAALTLFLILPQVTVKSLLIFDSKLIMITAKIFDTTIYLKLIAQCQTIVDETPASITSSVHENLSENSYSGKEKMLEAKSAENAEPSGELSKTKVLGSSQSPVECGSNLDHDEFDLSFNTTREEMILYEKFGQDYDEIVEKMTRDEKISLKQEISKATPKDANELLRAKEPTDVDGKADVNTIVSKVDKVKILKLRDSDSYKIHLCKCIPIGTEEG